MDVTTIFMIVLNLVLYGFSGYLYLRFLEYLWKNQATNLLGGRLAFKDILSIIAGIIVLGAMLVFGPYYMAKGIQLGWNNYMSIMVDVSNDIIADVQGMIDGTTPVYLPNTTSGGSSGVGGGLPQANDPNAGGGSPYVLPTDVVPPTPIIPEMVNTPVPVIPTPTLAPTATPFSADTWTPGQPAPTPVN